MSMSNKTQQKARLFYKEHKIRILNMIKTYNINYKN